MIWLVDGQAQTDPASDLKAFYAATVDHYDDWYLRRGRYSQDPISDAAFEAELDQATLWLDRLALGGKIVELAAGTGWWSPVLARRGELWLYDVVEEPLERARERLMAHGLAAHIHLRDAWAEPDRQVDAIFCGFWLIHMPRERLPTFLVLVRRWLKPGGVFAFIDSLPDHEHPSEEAPPEGGIGVARLSDGREYRYVHVHHSPSELEAALTAADFTEVEVTTTDRHFLMGRAAASD
jgi:ubiquinone/menaquinone biosynthesis C-methylase UbiE